MYYQSYEPPPPKRRHTGGPLVGLSLTVAAVLGVAAYVLLIRLSTEVLTIIATVGCAAGVSLPGLLVALVVLTRRAESSARQASPQPHMTQPQMIVVPPQMLLPQQQQAWPAPAPGLMRQPTPREFIVVGEDD